MQVTWVECSSRAFPVAFAWVSNETQGMYEWFLDAITVAYGEDINAIFVTDKCQALMNALDKKFPASNKLLCIWHMLNNVSDHYAGKFKNVAVKDEYANSVYKMIYSTTEAEYNSGLMAFQEATGNVNNYVDASKGLAVYECFVNEWISCKEKWEGYITCKLNHLGCTSTQRAESSHHALKKGLSAVLPLEGTFRNVNEFINNFERKYCQLEIEEATRVDILLYGDFQLQKLFKKVRYIAPSKVKFSALYALYGKRVKARKISKEAKIKKKETKKKN